ncbi:MAG: hypothetical protein P1P84_11010 [Deferrisomatales bacterium]|nr:hypothetical protein [Deferrisomatales bacterium]
MRPISALFALLVLLLASPPAPWAEEAPPSFHVVRPSGEAHELLPKTCSVCHRDSPFQFVVVASTTREGLDRALHLLSAPELEAVAEKPGNPHTSIACLFCHMEQPAAGANPAAMRFRTLTGEDVAVKDVTLLCQMCHPEGDEGHPKVLGKGKTAVALFEAGLPLSADTVVCTTCHDMHQTEVGMADLRLAYLKFAGKSPLSYVHGNRSGCLACHPTELAPDATPVFLLDDPTARCARCHGADHRGVHPMQVPPSEKTYPMDFLSYPLDAQGRLSCSTCHDEPCASGAGEGTGRRNPQFLRGGPYFTTTEFCYVCHPKAGLGALNPHQQIDDKGKLVTSTCTFCHRIAPDPEDIYEAYSGDEDLKFIHSPVELCAGCHETNAHPTGVNHLVEMPEQRRKQLEEYQKRHRVSIPLDGANRIVCTTCHNPHAKGVLADEAALGAGETHMWRVPSYAELCTPCHTRYD